MITEDEVKGEVFCVHAMKAYRGRRSIAPLNLDTKWRRVNFTHRPLYPRGKNPGTHSVGRWVGSRACFNIVEENVLLLLGFKPRSVQPLA